MIIQGLNHEWFRDNLIKHLPTTFDEINDRSKKFITAKEYALLRKSASIKNNQNPT